MTTTNDTGLGSEGEGASDPEALDWPQHGRAAGRGQALHIDLDGFEGPLDLLLSLARTEKVDITKISISALAEQYLDFIKHARDLKLELAADYLVMAAWLAYLKSKLLLPDTDDDGEPSGEELAARLAFRLRRLEAMREAAANLMARNRLGRDIFARGETEQIIINKKSEYTDNLYDLLTAYATRRQRTAVINLIVRSLPVMQINEALRQLETVLGDLEEWTSMDRYFSEFHSPEGSTRSITASTFTAGLELVREGMAELQQNSAFAPLYIRRAKSAAAPGLDPRANGR